MSRPPNPPGYEHCNLHPETRAIFIAAARAFWAMGDAQRRIVQELIPGQVQGLAGPTRAQWCALVTRGVVVNRRDEMWELSEIGVVMKQAGLGTRWDPKGAR